MQVNDHVLNTRGSGYSTAIALNAIAQAIANPGQRIYFNDHFDGKYADDMLRDLVHCIIKALSLEVTIDEDKHAIGYRGYRRAYFLVAKQRGVQVVQYKRRGDA